MRNLCAAFLAALVLIFVPGLLTSCGEPELAKLEIKYYPSSEAMRAARSSDSEAQYDESGISDNDEDFEFFETIAPETEPVKEPLPVETQAPAEPVETTIPETETETETETEPVTAPPETVAETEPVTSRPEPVFEASPVTSAPETLPPRSTNDTTDTVYWVANGEVWHLTESCPSLSRSKNIKSGSISEAMAAGKARVCKRCGKSE